MENPVDLDSQRKCEDLPPDNCLALIFGKVDLASRTFDVPFVCKFWYEVSLDPACWKILDLRDADIPLRDSSFVKRFKSRYRVKKFTLMKFLKFLIRRSNKSATKLFLFGDWVDLNEAIMDEYLKSPTTLYFPHELA